MSGKGQQSGRQGSSRQPPLLANTFPVVVGSQRRGRGRPRKYRLAASPQLPPDHEDRFEEQGQVYFEGEEPQEHVVVEESEEGDEHHAPIEHVQREEEIVEEEVVEVEKETPVQQASPVKDPIEESKKKLEEYVKGDQMSGSARRTTTIVAERFLTDLRDREQSTSAPIPIPAEEDRIEPLLPKQAHIEEAEEVHKDHHGGEFREEEEILEEEEEDDGSRPPPAPKNLVNRANMRGRPIAIPPHRRPIPKNLMPPGLPTSVSRKSQQQQKAASVERNVQEILRRARDEELQGPSSSTAPPPPPPPSIPEQEKSIEKPPPAPKIDSRPRRQSENEPNLQPQLQAQVLVKSSRKREAGQDLPNEHMPKQKARHVAKAGIVPNVTYEQLKTFEIPMDTDQVLMQEHHHMVMEQGGPSDGRRVYLENVEEVMDEEGNQSSNVVLKEYIEVEENGRKVVYEMQGDGESMEVVQEQEGNQDSENYMLRDENHEKQEIDSQQNADDDDELPPQLIPEEVQDDEVVAEAERRHEEVVMKKEIVEEEEEGEIMFDPNAMAEGSTFRLASPGGRSHQVHVIRDEEGNTVFVDENGLVVELVSETAEGLDDQDAAAEHLVDETQAEQQEVVQQLEVEQPQVEVEHNNRGTARNFEFNFLDSRNISCGLCGEVVAYDSLVSEHLPNVHPELFEPGVEMEDVPYEDWLKTRLSQEKKTMQNGFRNYDEQMGVAGFGGAPRLISRNMRSLRKVSQIRVNPHEMTLDQLEHALRRKMFEKLGRKVPVDLVDRLHARCNVCQAVVSLNKKFEVVHLVRHFNAWHPSEHKCTGTWKTPPAAQESPVSKTLSLHDFAVVDTESEQNNLQCIWCGMFMDKAAIGMHFSEVHSDQVQVPKCSLCLQEMVTSARILEKYGDDFEISLPDEFHIESGKLRQKFSSHKSLDKAIERYLKRVRSGQIDPNQQGGEEDVEEENNTICTTNSQQSFGRRNRMKRKFVKPCFRQICPTNSVYFEAFSACEWRCKLCNKNVYGAVISAGAIKHYKEFHPGEIDNMQYELVKARLERISDGSMEFVHPQLVECLICNLTYALHKPFNLCRAIRHLRIKHPEIMPEASGKSINGSDFNETTTTVGKAKKQMELKLAEVITDAIDLERFRRENEGQEIERVQVVYGAKPNNEPSYILLGPGEVLDAKSLAERLREEMEVIEGEEVEEAEAEVPDSRFTSPVKRQPTMQEQLMYIANSAASSDAESHHYESISTERNGREDHFPREIVEGEDEEERGKHQEVMEYIYEGNDQQEGEEEEEGVVEGEEVEDHQVIINDGDYQVIRTNDGRFAELHGDSIHYMTDEDLEAAQARGDIRIELIDGGEEVVYEPYDGEQTQ